MARYRRSNWNASVKFASAPRRRKWKSRTIAGGYATSPAGKHRRLALHLFGVAKKARSLGNGRHRWVSKLARRALALSKAEYRMWKRGLTLQRRSVAVKRAALQTW
jgi:hypothetical protein